MSEERRAVTPATPVWYYAQWVHPDGLRIVLFDCPVCEKRIELTRREPGVEMSMTFCRECCEQYWTCWNGMVYRGELPARWKTYPERAKEEKETTVNYYDAREKTDADGNPSGLYHYTAENDNRIYPVGYCAAGCPGHVTPDEAREHYRLYLLDSARYDGVMEDEQRKCEVCGDWTQQYVHIPASMERHVLCNAHRNRETLDRVMHRVGQIISS